MTMTKGEKIENPNISTLSVNRLVETLSDLISKAVDNNISFCDLPAIMLWGMPGVGKSQAVRAIAQKVGKLTAKRTHITDVRLLLFNPIDLRGIPVADASKSFAIWLKPKIFDMDPSPSVINFLFLDEISAAPPSVQAAAYQITLDRIIGEHKLPDNCFVISAGNRVTDKSVAYKMPKALANRLCHFEVEADFDSWKRWAEEKQIDYRIIGFLTKRRDLLTTFNPSNEEVAFATPRSWEMVSNIISAGNYSDLEKCFPIISGLVGQGIASEFITWCKTNAFVPDIIEIVYGACKMVPKTTDGVHATIRLMMHYIKSHPSDKPGLENCVRYAQHFSPDMTASFYKELISYDKEIFHNKTVENWIKTHSKLFI